jgi:hypothetical protein
VTGESSFIDFHHQTGNDKEVERLVRHLKECRLLSGSACRVIRGKPAITRRKVTISD